MVNESSGEKQHAVVNAMVVQHWDESVDLWLRRDTLMGNPRAALRQLANHDDRLDAQLDGLRVAHDAGCRAFAEADDPGALFPAMVLALEYRDSQHVEALLSQAEAVPRLQTPLISAFGWVSASFLQGIVKSLLASASSFRRRVGIACCVMHGANPGQVLNAAAVDADPVLRATALYAAGELGRGDLDSTCERALSDSDSACRFGAARSAVMLGNRGVALDALTGIGMEPGAHSAHAFRLSLQSMKITASHAVLQRFAGDAQRLPRLIQGSGIVGDPKYVDWLIGRMADDQVARFAGEAFGLITAVDLVAAKLERPRPEGFESGPNDDPEDPNVEMDPDEELPWPDVAKIEKWWAAHASRFQKGTRYFMGAPVTRQHCIDVLKNGYQRQRVLAAHYLCLLEPGTPLFNTSAPAWRQQRLIAKLT